MTTNARNEKWSEWVAVKCQEDMPTEESLIGQWRASDGFISKETHLCDVSVDAGRLVTAYRYKIKEPESDVHPDLEWLARNVSKWHEGRIFACVRRQYVTSPAELYWSDFVEDDHKVTQWTKPSFVQARKELGLDQPAGKLNKCLDNAWDEPTPEEEEAWQAKEQKQGREQYSAYFKDVRHIDTIDVYRVVSLFDCEKHGHAISHAAKKLLLTGARTGGKDVETEVREAIDSLHRWLEMREEDVRA